MIKVDANLFRIVHSTVSKEETRYYINGVFIHPNHDGIGAILVATDGHRMLVAYDESAECDETAIVKLHKDALAQCKTRSDTASRRLVVNKSTNRATIQDDGRDIMVVYDAIIDGTFPDWRRVSPHAPCAQDAVRPATFNPAYVKEWGAIALDIAKTLDVGRELQIYPSDGSSPSIVRFSADNLYGVQMPMRSDVAGFLPPFMNVPAATRTQAAE